MTTDSDCRQWSQEGESAGAGLPTVEDLEHWDDPVVGTPEKHRRWLETGDGAWLDSLS